MFCSSVRLFVALSPKPRCLALPDWPGRAGGPERSQRCCVSQTSARNTDGGGDYRVGQSGRTG